MRLSLRDGPEGAEHTVRDIRTILGLPPRSTDGRRQVARAAIALKKIQRASVQGSKRRAGSISRRSRGAESVALMRMRYGRADLQTPSIPLQRVSLRWTYTKNRGDGQWRAHGRYIERESAQEHAAHADGMDEDRLMAHEGTTHTGMESQHSRVYGFGSEGDTMPISETLERWQDAGDAHVFKLIVSPEFGDRMDMETHTRVVMQQMEQDLGTRLEWVGIIHHNTAHPHAHVAIRGVDETGKTLEVAPAYIKHGARIRAQEEATRQLGYRSERDVADAYERQIVQQRVTDIDRALMRKAVHGAVRGVITMDGLPPKSEKAREARLRQIRRLAQLATMGLAERTDSHTWRLHPQLESVLRQVQIGSDRLKTRHAHREMISDPHAPLRVTDMRAPNAYVSGKVVGTGWQDGSKAPYLLVEGLDGVVHYLTQWPSMQKMRAEGVLRVGEYVSMDRHGVVCYGKEMTETLVRRTIKAHGTLPDRIGDPHTVAGAFRQAAHTLTQEERMRMPEHLLSNDQAKRTRLRMQWQHDQEQKTKKRAPHKDRS